MRSLRLAAAAAALTLVLAACGGSSSSSTSSSTGGSSSASVQPAGGGGKKVNVTLKDFSITIAGGTKLAPARYSFVVTNDGPSSHNLTINGPGVSNAATPTFASGTQTLTVTLKKGSYEFYCSVPGHKQLGMDDTVTVG
jgi:plastocyanin